MAIQLNPYCSILIHLNPSETVQRWPTRFWEIPPNLHAEITPKHGSKPISCQLPHMVPNLFHSRLSTQSETRLQILPDCLLSQLTHHTAILPIRVCWWWWCRFWWSGWWCRWWVWWWRWCSGHSHTGELQVFDCINLASRVSFLSLILKKTEERNAHWAFFLSLFFQFNPSQPIVIYQSTFRKFSNAFVWISTTANVLNLPVFCFPIFPWILSSGSYTSLQCPYLTF